MKNLPEELIYVLIFGAIMLFQYMMKRFGSQEEEQQPPPPLEESDPELPAREQEQAPAQVFRAAAAAEVRFDRSAAPGASPALAQRRFSRSSLMGNRCDVQNAIVIAAIMGPCRAFEPHSSGDRPAPEAAGTGRAS